VAGLFAAGALLWRSGGDATSFTPLPTQDPGPVHVHGLGIDPADGALFIATHTGLFRVEPGERKAKRVGDRYQDTMGFTVAGPNRFLGSGHPDLREAREKGLPPLLGLIESTDAGETWKPVSLLGEADFHVLRRLGGTVYGYDSSNGRLLASADGGRTWEELATPGPILDIAVDPGQPRRLVSSAGLGLFASSDGGETWRPLTDVGGLLAWPVQGPLYVVTAEGRVLRSADGGSRFTRVGQIGAQPAALLAAAPRDLYVALHDGTIKRSTDGGATWTVRSTP
jgi:hypothetical protein